VRADRLLTPSKSETLIPPAARITALTRFSARPLRTRLLDGRYRGDLVLSSFLATFPASNPQYVLLVTLDRPQPAPDTNGQITAGLNAAPTAGRIIARIGPLMRSAGGDAATVFDASRDAK